MLVPPWYFPLEDIRGQSLPCHRFEFPLLSAYCLAVANQGSGRHQSGGRSAVCGYLDAVSGVGYGKEHFAAWGSGVCPAQLGALYPAYTTTVELDEFGFAPNHFS